MYLYNVFVAHSKVHDTAHKAAMPKKDRNTQEVRLINVDKLEFQRG